MLISVAIESEAAQLKALESRGRRELVARYVVRVGGEPECGVGPKK